jgi:hypothetical protein
LNPIGALRFKTAAAGRLRVRVFDLNGRLVRTLVDRSSASADRYEIPIDGRDAQGRALASGVYFFRIESAGGAETGRFAILR